jgi:DNA repair protein RadC
MSLRIADLPEDDRPRERLLRLGPQSLSDAELVGIFINTGLPGENAVKMAERLIHERGSLHALADTDPSYLQRLKGLGPAKAATLAAAFELGRRAAQQRCLEGPLNEPELVYEFLHPRLGNLPHEELHVLLLNVKGYLLRSECISRGGPAEVQVHPREIVKLALIHSASSIIVAHNHPSGDPSPSRADFDLTRRIDTAARTVGVSFLDHIIIGHPRPGELNHWHSFRAAGLLNG